MPAMFSRRICHVMHLWAISAHVFRLCPLQSVHPSKEKLPLKSSHGSCLFFVTTPYCHPCGIWVSLQCVIVIIRVAEMWVYHPRHFQDFSLQVVPSTLEISRIHRKLKNSRQQPSFCSFITKQPPLQEREEDVSAESWTFLHYSGTTFLNLIVSMWFCFFHLNELSESFS